MRLIDADALAEDLLYDAELCARALDSYEITDHKELERLQFEKDCKQNCVYYISESPTVDAAPVCRCAECKHRPTKPEEYYGGFDLAFPDEVCPCYCDDDPFYSWYPKDDWFCPNGERKGGDE